MLALAHVHISWFGLFPGFGTISSMSGLIILRLNICRIFAVGENKNECLIVLYLQICHASVTHSAFMYSFTFRWWEALNRH